MTLQQYSLTVALVVFLFGQPLGSQPASTSAHPDTSGWEDLFAPDLSNARVSPGEWVMEDGVLSARGHGMIWSRKSYGNFVLDLEFKVARGANSGVFLRAADTEKPITGIEVQIHETTDGTKYGMVGAIYDAVAPARDVAKPAGQWNRYTIACVDSRVYVVFNGEQVVNIDLEDWTEPHRNPDGTRNKFSKALKDYPRAGPIGLQGIHGQAGQPVWFRNLKVRSLE